MGLLLYLIIKAKLNNFIIPILFIASIIFYYFSGWIFTGILFLSIIVNYLISQLINCKKQKLIWLWVGVVFNILYLILFKYYDFATILLTDFNKLKTFSTLPLGISFYTFTQIGFLIDQYQGSKTETSLIKYSLYVSFFPSISSGPIVVYDSIRSQFSKISVFSFKIDTFTRAFCLLLIGMFKKVILSDYVGTLANSVFDAVQSGVIINNIEAWIGSIGFTLQLYFDFSGYSDIAIAIAMMIGINLPSNFNSPYKAKSIIEFWRRWHMSLSNWLNNYIFEPVNYLAIKKINSKKSLIKNPGLIAYGIGTLITMSLCGLWHGTSLNFIIWGVLNALLIILNRIWNIYFELNKHTKTNIFKTLFYQILTFITLNFCWVLFRSSNFISTIKMWEAMVGSNGLYIPDFLYNKIGHIDFFPLTSKLNHLFINSRDSLLSIFINLSLLLVLVFFLPNSKEVIKNECQPIKNKYLYKVAKTLKLDNGWNLSFSWLVIMSFLLVSIFTWSKINSFLYFNF